MIALVNFNTYLGGGETLFVRFALFLENHGIDYISICRSNSFIYNELHRNKITSSKLVGVNSNIDYFYLSKKERAKLKEEIFSNIPNGKLLHFLTFCMRDLYTISELNNICNGTISHLILHNQDYLYVCQTLLDKLRYKVNGKRKFCNADALKFNSTLLSYINSSNGLIPMSWIITKMWKREVGISMSDTSIVPVPCFKKKGCKVSFKEISDKSILWIGRLVDFKLASLYVILNFIKRRPDYTLSIVGDGDFSTVHNYIHDNDIPENNVIFLGQVDYEDLGKIIIKHSIGYASGSSIIEMTKYGLPVVMALQDNKHKPFVKDICGGLFCNTSKGNFAEDLCLFNEDEIITTIDDVFDEIESNYQECAKKCYDYTVKEYDEDANFAEYISLIKATKPINEIISIPEASFIRKLLYRLIK